MAVTHWLWGAGLALQLALLCLLFLQGIARRLPVFTTLIAFYTVRSAALFLLSPHIARPQLLLTLDVLALLDTLLQIAVFVEAVQSVVRRDGWTRLRAGAVVLTVALAVAGAALAGRVWPAHGQAELDRGQAFAALCFLLFGAVMLPLQLRGRTAAARVIAGFAAFSAASLAAQIVRYRAVTTRSGVELSACRYGAAVVYLAVLIFWLATLGRDGSGPERESAREPRRPRVWGVRPRTQLGDAGRPAH